MANAMTSGKNGRSMLWESVNATEFWDSIELDFRFEDLVPGFKGYSDYSQISSGNTRLCNPMDVSFFVDEEFHIVIFSRSHTDGETRLIYRSLGEISGAESFPGGGPGTGGEDSGLEVFTTSGETIWLLSEEYRGCRPCLYSLK